MLISNFSKYLFWSYNNDADLPDSIIIKQVTAYGEIDDLKKLSKLYEKEIILNVLSTLHNKNTKRINFMKKVIL